MRLDHLLSKEKETRALKDFIVYFSMYFYSTFYFKYLFGAVAQLARAPALQAGGQEFDSPHLHHRNYKVPKSTLKNI